MADKLPPEQVYWRQRDLCLDHARDLITSAEMLLPASGGYPNIAYHLAILALEEVGKAGMLGARAVTKDGFDTAWMDKRLDSHVWKLMWGVWAPTLSGKIDPKDFEEARHFAESTHARRMAGLYVDYGEDANLAPPRAAVRPEHATSLLNLAKACLEMESAKGAPTPGEGREELDWFLATVNDPVGQQRLFSQSFVKKHQEFGGDTRAWVRWARDEFKKIADDEKAHLQRELSRQASAPGHRKPKWLMKIRIQTPSHSIRQKVLNFWNDRIDSVKLRAVGNKSNDLLFEITIGDHIKVEQLFDFGLSFSRMHLVMLNIGTGGFFWYELSGQAETYYESIRDLEAPRMSVAIGRTSGLAREWMQTGQNGQRRERVALEEAHLNSAINALAVFGFLPDAEAEPIFGQYLQALALSAKMDLHLIVGNHARNAFMLALRRALVRFGDMKGEDEEVLPVLHRVMEPIIPTVEHRDKIFAGLESAGQGSIGEVIAVKWVTDLYLSLVARRLWPDFVKRMAESEKQGSPDASTSGS